MMILDDVQIIKENDEAKFAVIHFEDYLILQSLLSNEEKLADYLDYLHMENVKKQTRKRLNLAEVKQELALG